MIIHQFHSGTGKHDAVTNELLRIQRTLRRLGHESTVFAEHIDPALHGTVRPHRELERAACDLLIVHHSMGHGVMDLISRLPHRKVLRYHNITPAHFFGSIPAVAHGCQLGRDQLATLRAHVEAAWPCSTYNGIELAQLGYQNITVLPYAAEVPEVRVLERARARGRAPHWLFVGRFVYNKRQDDLIRLLAAYNRAHPQRPATLVLIGNDIVFPDYAEHIRSMIDEHGVREHVNWIGPASDEVLWEWYRKADLFVSMSEHEGFCVPVVEALAHGLPVVAYSGGAIAETMGDSGLALFHKELDVWIDVVYRAVEDDETRRRLTDQAVQIKSRFGSELFREQLERVLHALDVPRSARRSVLWEGPFETSYSLAFVNRQSARAWDAMDDWQVALRPSEGPGDYEPKLEHLLKYPDETAMWLRGLDDERPDVHVRYMYPPRTTGMRGKTNILYWAWEEGGIPAEWIHDFNRDLDGIAVPSAFVRDALVNNGIAVPVRVIPHGVVKDAEVEVFELPQPAAGFSFLHVSSAFPRKGVDVLLEAYFESFTAKDDVALVLKTFPNPHNDVAEQLTRLRKKHRSHPRVIHLDCDLPRAELLGLFELADAFVAPSRGEGFGLPIAEAMKNEVPVIVTDAGGHRQFCNEENSWLVASHPEPADTHLSRDGSTWFEPDPEALGRLLRWHYEHAKSPERAKRVSRARRDVDALTWEATAAGLADFATELSTRRVPRVAMVTTWNVRCGLATYSKYLMEHVEPGLCEWRVFADRAEADDSYEVQPVQRCWDQLGSHQSYAELGKALDAWEPDVVHFQFNYGLFQLEDWSELMHSLSVKGCRVFATLHATKPVEAGDRTLHLGLAEKGLRAANAVIVHAPADRETVREFVDCNIEVIPHGSLTFRDEAVVEVRRELGLEPASPVVSTFGFLLPPKGILELIDAVAALRNAHPNIVLLGLCSLYPAPESEHYYSECLRRIDDLGIQNSVRLITDYLPEDVIMKLLHASDVVAMPYTRSGESASGALRFPLASGRPVITTDLPIFDVVRDCTHSVAPADAEALAQGIQELLNDPKRAAELVQRSLEKTRSEAWERVSAEHVERYTQGARQYRGRAMIG